MEAPGDEKEPLRPAEEESASEDLSRRTVSNLQAPPSTSPALQSVWPAGHAGISLRPERPAEDYGSRVYAALDLGTNNCRLLIARPSRRGFHVVDAFSRIIRLGEGVTASGRLCDAAMDRTWDALRVCAAKMRRHAVARARLVATEACRVARNGPEFLGRIGSGLGLHIEILSREAEARLAVSGCATLLDDDSDLALVFDIGGGSSELVWLDLSQKRGNWRRSLGHRLEAMNCIAAWTSLPIGVVTLAERFGGRHLTPAGFESMVDSVTELLEPFEARHRFRARVEKGHAHLLGTSGTVTTVAGIKLGLPRYDRSRVDGCWLDAADARAVTYDLLARSHEQRVAEPCIGEDRAELVLAGCAILEGLLRMWPAKRLRVADRGLREGMLATMMAEDANHRGPHRRDGRPV
ncbi:MAG: Ppx/GppA family phosphatase [Hyphomicrobiaceae bacterium]|nr:Ppx/GppA family phosphatase [Hyphomicrobiaceae bacterium]